MNTKKRKLVDQLNIIWTIASKDILDSLRNKLVLSLVIGLVFVLLMPQMMGLIIQPPYIEVRVFDPSKSNLLAALTESEQYNVVRSSSVEALKSAIGSTGMGLGAEFGLAVPEEFDRLIESGEPVTLKGYVAWANRAKAERTKMEFEADLATLIEDPGILTIDIEIVYPNIANALMLSLSTLSALVVILMMGLSLVPHLLFEEKQTRTIDALLVSPASQGQVIAGKALAGAFYILVAAVVVFAINLKGVVHWDVAALFVVACGVFTVAIGLALGTFFSRQQEVTGLTMVILAVLIGAVFVRLMDLNVPGFVHAILPWVPAVPLLELIQFVFVRDFDWSQVWLSLMRLVVVSVPLYILVIWRIGRSDR
jgi:ABC-2 type transport system permease protein